MSFIIWHLLAICSVMAASFLAGFIVGKARKEQGYEN
jgi:hypothetical protein